MVRQAAKLVLEEATHQEVPLAVLERLFLALVAKTSTAKHKDVCVEAAVRANLACKSAIRQAPDFASTSSWKHHLLNNSLGSHLYAAVSVEDAVGQEAAQSCCATLATSLGGSVDWAAAIAAAPGLSVAAREELTAVQPPPPPPTSPNPPPPPPPREPSAASAGTTGSSSQSEASTSGLSSKDEVFVREEADSLWSEVESGTMSMSEAADLIRENVKEGDYNQQQADAILSTLKARQGEQSTPKRKDSESSSSSSSDSSDSDSDDKLIDSINSANNDNINGERNDDDDDDSNDNGTIALSGAEEKQVVSEFEELWSEVKSGGISMNEIAELVNGGVDEGDYSKSQGHEILRRIKALAKEANIN